jgi:hypothetical protein
MKPPDYPQDGKPVADTIKEIIDYCKATTINNVQGGRIKQSRGGSTLVIPTPSQRRKPRPLPFEITLGRDGSAWFVTVAQGFVVERALSALDGENALVLHECDNRLNEDDNPTKFTIAVGEAIFVKVLEDEFGRVKGGADLVLVVDAATEESRNFIPGGGDGITLYKLAELVARGSSVELKYVLSGSHIFHSTGLTADFRIIDCPSEPETEPTQLIRLSFVSGKLHSIGASVETRPLSENLEEIGIDSVCT